MAAGVVSLVVETIFDCTSDLIAVMFGIISIFLLLLSIVDVSPSWFDKNIILIKRETLEICNLQWLQLIR